MINGLNPGAGACRREEVQENSNRNPKQLSGVNRVSSCVKVSDHIPDIKVSFDPASGVDIKVLVYEVVDYLGIGTFSLVFRVKKLETGRFYAAKISRCGGFSKDGKAS